MNCSEVRSVLPALFDGELLPAVEADVRRHLAGCFVCRSSYAGYCLQHQARVEAPHSDTAPLGMAITPGRTVPASLGPGRIGKPSRLTVAAVGLFTVLTTVLLVTAIPASNMAQVDALQFLPGQNEAQVRASLPALKLLWKYSTPFYLEGAPAVADGTLYAIMREDYNTNSSCHAYHGNWCYHLYALDLETAKLTWELDDFEYSPTVADGTLYSGWDGVIFAVDIRTQQIKWQFKTDRVTQYEGIVTRDVTHAPTVADGVVYFGSGNTLYAIDAHTGAQLWGVNYADEIVSSPIVVDDILYIEGSYIKLPSDVIFRQSNLYAVRTSNGQQLWKFEPPSMADWAPGQIGGLVVGAEGTVYCTRSMANRFDDPGSVVALDGKTGMKLWERSPGGKLARPSGLSGRSDGLLYVADTENNLHALDRKNGDEHWKISAHELTSNFRMFSYDTLYITDFYGPDDVVVSLDSRSGKQIGRYHVEEDYNLKTIATDNDLYFIGRRLSDIYLFGLPTSKKASINP